MEIASALGSIIPILFVTEMAYFWIKGEFLWVKFKVPIQIQLANMLIAIVLTIAITLLRRRGGAPVPECSRGGDM